MCKDITGERFGRLVAVKCVSRGKHGKSIWECKCDCGNTTEVRRSNLISGNTKSCGCARFGINRTKDISGNRYGRLIALYPTDKKLSTNVIWMCQCDCGNRIEVCNINLTSGNTKSCGCLGKETSQINIKKAIQHLIRNDFVEDTSLCLLTCKTSKLNKTGHKGVCFDKSRNKFVAYIQLKKHRKHLGYFENYYDAVSARESAEEEMFEPILKYYGRERRNKK